MGHVPDQEKGEQRTLQRIFWPKGPSVVMPKEDPDSLGTPWIQQVADEGGIHKNLPLNKVTWIAWQP